MVAIKQYSIQPPYISFFVVQLWKNIPVGGFYAIIPIIYVVVLLSLHVVTFIVLFFYYICVYITHHQDYCHPFYFLIMLILSLMTKLTSCKISEIWWEKVVSNTTLFWGNKKVKVQTWPCACTVHMQMHVAFFAGDDCIQSAFVNSLSGGSPLLGGISTNLFLFRVVVIVPSWGVAFTSMCRKCILTTLLTVIVSKAEVFCSWYMQTLEPCAWATWLLSCSLMKGWMSFSSSSKMIVIVDHNIMLGIILLMQVERFWKDLGMADHTPPLEKEGEMPSLPSLSPSIQFLNSTF